MRILLALACCLLGVRAQDHVVRFGSEDIGSILDTHNALRRTVKDAANMRELSWNEGVALAASEWGSKCEYVDRGDNQWGQNMNYFHGNDYHKRPIELFQASFHAWSNETRHADYKEYRYCGQKNACSYVQLIAADVQQLGCAIVKCPRLEFQAPHGVEKHAKLLVCFYTPWTNILADEFYAPGERCSSCPPGTTCVDNLCSARFYDGKNRIDNTLNGRSHGAIESISGPPTVTIIPDAGSGIVVDKQTDQSTPAHVSRDTTQVSRDKTKSERRDKKGRRRDRSRRRRKGHRGNRRRNNRVIGSHNTFPEDRIIPDENRVYQEHKEGQETRISTAGGTGEKVVVYKLNNRVVPFPGRGDRRIIRRIEKYEAKNEKDIDEKQERLTHKLELVATDITVKNVSALRNVVGASDSTAKSRLKRQTSYDYEYRLRYRRYLDQYNRLLRERERRRREHEERLYRRELEMRRQRENMAHELRQRERQNQMAQELRQANGQVVSYNDYNTYYHNEMLRRQRERDRRYAELRQRERRLQEERRRYQALALTQNEGDLTGEEQFFTISAHNLLRREAGAKDLAWSSHLERWAKYVIRCETEYPGPITCFTNFGKARPGQDIYNVVYEWGNEGDDMRRPLQNGCRTPYDKSLCNHNTVVRDRSLSQMACASKQCGVDRQLTCIYSSG